VPGISRHYTGKWTYTVPGISRHYTGKLTLNLLQALASTAILGSGSNGTHDHILMSDGSGSLRNSPTFFLFIYGTGVEPSPLLLRPLIVSLYQPWVIDGDDCGAVGSVNGWRGKPKCSEKTCASATLSISDPT
jgi:hypothetical protein